MDVKDLAWNETMTNRYNNPLFPRSIRGLIVGKFSAQNKHDTRGKGKERKRFPESTNSFIHFRRTLIQNLSYFNTLQVHLVVSNLVGLVFKYAAAGQTGPANTRFCCLRL